jgi:hypothetical protein
MNDELLQRSCQSQLVVALTGVLAHYKNKKKITLLNRKKKKKKKKEFDELI